MNSIRFKAIKAVFKKEMLDILRDKRTLAIMILLPLILYPLLLVVGSQVSMMMMHSREDKILSVAFDFSMDTQLETLVKENRQDYKLDIKYLQNPAEALEKQEILSYVTLKTVNGKEVYEIHFNSSRSAARNAADRIEALLEDYKQILTYGYLEGAGLDAEMVMEPISFTCVDVAADEQITGMFLGMILPFLLIIALVTGAMYPAIDVTSGEKERGTLETLLTLPVSSMELMGGKYLAVSVVAVTSAILNFISLTLVGIFLMNSMASQAFNEEMALQLNLHSLALPFLLILACIMVFALFVSAVVLCVTSMAKSFKEANNYMTPVILILMLPAMITMVPEVSLTTKTAAIPIVNISLLIRDALTFEYNALNIAVVLISNMGYALIAITVLSRIYNSENTLFGTGGELNLLGRRSQIIPGSKISPGDGLMIYLAGLLLLFYLGSLFMQKFGFYGIAVTQMLVLALPVLAALYLKADIKETFKLRLPHLRDITGGLILWVGAFILANLAGSLLLRLFPQNQEVVQQLALILKGETLWITLLVVALLPAICEELFFRGFIFSSLEGSFKTGVVIFLTGFMFAFYHLDFIRIAPTFILGVLFTLALFKTGSIVVPMIMHFVNNAVAVLILFYPETVEGLNPVAAITDSSVLQIAIYVLTAVVFIFIGWKFIYKDVIGD